MDQPTIHNDNQIILFGLTKNGLATLIAIVFHAIGLIGIVFFKNNFFIKTTSINLLLMFFLLLYTQSVRSNSFFLFIAICFVTGIAVELIGTKTGLLFGDYAYGDVLGISFSGVPLIIGINWFIVIYCCGISMSALLNKIMRKQTSAELSYSPKIKVASLIFDGATIAVLFDWLMEPVAVKLGYWKWGGFGEIPLYNYVCWFLISIFLLILFDRLKFKKTNKFAVHLLLIQAMFFLLLRTFL